MEEKNIDVSQTIRDLNYSLLEAIAEVTNESSLEDFYMFLVRNIVYKLRDFCDLYTRSAIEGANIILRAAFEEIVLFEYLSHKSEDIEKYILDSEIEEFKLSFEFFLDDFVTKEYITSEYEKLSELAKNSIEIFWNRPMNLKDKRTKKEGKGIAQQTRDLIDELIKINSSNSTLLKEKRKLYYTNSCTYAHSTYSRIILRKTLSNEESLEKILRYSLYSLDLIKIILSNIIPNCSNKKCIKHCQKSFKELREFTIYVESKKEKSIIKGS